MRVEGPILKYLFTKVISLWLGGEVDVAEQADEAVIPEADFRLGKITVGRKARFLFPDRSTVIRLPKVLELKRPLDDWYFPIGNFDFTNVEVADICAVYCI